jgi:glycosyltransferase involved in cell wall biosynthesis
MVSIIVTCYNQEAYLAECLDSVLNQTFPNWECVIINDGSTDRSEIIAKEYVSKDNRFHYIFQKNQGVVAARNNAIESSKGKYILPLDGDDIIAKDYLELAIPILEKDDDVQLVYCDVEYFGAKCGRMGIWEVTLRNILSGGCCVNSSVFRRKTFDEVGGYKECMRYGLEDWEFFVSLVEKGGKFHKINKSLFFYRISPTSRNNTIDDTKDEILRNQVVQLHPNLYYNEYCKLLRDYNALKRSRKYQLINFIFKPYDLLRKLLYKD